MRTSAPRSRPRLGAAVGAAVLGVALVSCGLPGDGDTRRVDDDAVPYRLLDDGDPSSAAAGTDQRPGRVPVVFWLEGELLVPEATGDTCREDGDALVAHLLEVLDAGASEETRAAGRSSALPPDPGLEVVAVSGGTVQVDIRPESSLSAELVPVAVGQVVLTLTSAPTVRAVEFVSDGEPLAVPVTGGALTDGPVTAANYADLLPDRLRATGSLGCPAR